MESEGVVLVVELTSEVSGCSVVGLGLEAEAEAGVGIRLETELGSGLAVELDVELEEGVEVVELELNESDEGQEDCRFRSAPTGSQIVRA